MTMTDDDDNNNDEDDDGDGVESTAMMMDLIIAGCLTFEVLFDRLGNEYHTRKSTNSENCS